jgi:hypothetical protein
MLVRMWSSGNSHLLLLEMQNDRANLEDSLEGFHKTKHILPHHQEITVEWINGNN